MTATGPLLADLVLTGHLGFAAFIVLGLAAIGLGAWRGWGWVRRRAFRYAHLGAIAFVAVEALVGMVCPLTLLEHRLRGGTGAPPETFIGRLMAGLLYYDLPAWVFTAVYVLLVLLALWLLRAVPVRTRR